MMRYAAIKKNDVANAPGISVSVYLQGCPHHCFRCFNPETWDPNGGYKFGDDQMNEILDAMQENGIKRSLCLLGGEPLCPENAATTEYIIRQVKSRYPSTKTYIWTGYKYEDLVPKENSEYAATLYIIFQEANYLIDGPYIDAERDITLKMRGSRNQRIIDLKTRKDVTKEFDNK